jgi:DNA-binding HxlR family transcriptional regulator
VETSTELLKTPDVYAADCPTRQMLDRISDKWTPLIIGLLAGGPQRFSELQHTIGGISHTMLSQTLRSLQRDGLVSRMVYPEPPLKVEYRLTPLGETLCGPMEAIVRWSEEHIDEVIAAQAKYDTRKEKAITDV